MPVVVKSAAHTAAKAPRLGEIQRLAPLRPHRGRYFFVLAASAPAKASRSSRRAALSTSAQGGATPSARRTRRRLQHAGTIGQLELDAPRQHRLEPLVRPGCGRCAVPRHESVRPGFASSALDSAADRCDGRRCLPAARPRVERRSVEQPAGAAAANQAWKVRTPRRGRCRARGAAGPASVSDPGRRFGARHANLRPVLTRTASSIAGGEIAQPLRRGDRASRRPPSW